MQRLRGSLPWLPWWVLRGSDIWPVLTHTTSPVSKLHPHHAHSSFQAVTSQSLQRHGIDHVGHSVPVRPCVLCGSCIATRRSKTQLRHYAVDSGSDLEDSGYMSDSEFDFDKVDSIKFLDKDKFDQLRVTLYPSSSDSILKAITEANSIQEVFDLVEKCGDHLTAEHASQAVVTLWDLQKIYGRHDWDCFITSGSLRQQFLDKVVLHPVFERLVTKLEYIYKDLNSVALTCMLLYLHKIGVRNESPLMQKLLMQCLEGLDQFNLSALSRLSVYLRDLGLQAYFVQSKLLAVVADKLSCCSTYDDLHLLTICLNSCKRILTESVMDRYIFLIEQKLNENFFENCNPKIMLKIAKLLTYHEWSSRPRLLSQHFMLQLAEQINDLSVSQVVDLGSIFSNYLEPRKVLQKIQQYSLNVVEEAKVSDGTPAVLCLAPFTSTKMKNYFEELMAQHLHRTDFYEFIVIYFKTLRFIKTSNFKLCNAFWMRSMESVEKEIKKQRVQSLGVKDMMRRKIYHRYMYFNNNIGGTYRNSLFERRMSEMLLEDIDSHTGLVPSKLANMSSFLLGYCPSEGLPEDLVDRLLQCGSQFSIYDIMMMSRGIQITHALNNNFKRTLMQQVTALSRMMDTMTEEHLKNAKSMVDVTNIARGYLSRHGSTRTLLLDKIIAAYIPVLDQLDSRHVRHISLFLTKTRYASPELLDKIIEYICKHHDYIHVETAEMVLSCLYHLGYHPPEHHHQQFINICTSTFLEDGHLMNGFHILQTCLALNMFGSLPPNLIHDVFNLSFMDQLDQEISKCYSKATYPLQVRHLVMELNRAVCLDHPAENIPWFHEKYCQELLETVAVPSSVFHTEVYQALVQLVGGPEVLRASVHTPYYYFLDFEFLLDAKNHPVPVKEYTVGPNNSKTHQGLQQGSKLGYRRIALLVRKESQYCVNMRQLLGHHQVERRHLEVLGYEVVEVSHFHWYSMALSTFEDKLIYLRGLIYPSQGMQTNIPVQVQ